MLNNRPAPILHRNAQPHALVTYGAYPQTADGADRTPIQWRVLQNAGGELFLLSEHLLDCKRYHSAFVETAWRDCDLRRWLNEEFYYAVFTAAERQFIVTVRCTDNGAGSPDTEDKVFLLSVAEVQALTVKHGEDLARAQRRAIGTAFAKARKSDGCHLYVYDKTVGENYITVNGEESGCSWWWLRTQPERAARAFFVGTHSSIRSYGRVNLPYYGVRPALKLHLPE